ncbi:hypothetical protein Q765_03280 [Flavobacterium rivuli WB 3.3-2 = DSM 21788]|uniref:Ig-like domain-containing protein n=1 Tax=Flavobacterium rivuli WB 3.3-2 = DSM 21788 TaxID=1121895 RepID=A0A0A2MIE5_9FLAO|nr:hypothetical protein [Flavobacterium rivuli]KGO88090.1 hypothetical protein Q765_03280 [Flavobacterium rivuli WB 3.3-2 = DSM 21788]
MRKLAFAALLLIIACSGNDDAPAVVTCNCIQYAEINQFTVGRGQPYPAANWQPTGTPIVYSENCEDDGKQTYFNRTIESSGNSSTGTDFVTEARRTVRCTQNN